MTQRDSGPNEFGRRYGWLIQLASMLLMLSWYLGGMEEKINSVIERLATLERAVYFQTRGVPPKEPGVLKP